MNPNNFILNSDFASFENDTQGNTISITISSGTTWGGASLSDTVLGQTNQTVGTINAGIRAHGRTSQSSRRGTGTTVLFQADTTHIPSGSPIPDQTYIGYLYRTSATNLRLSVEAYGVGTGGGANDFRIDETVTVTFDFSTFLSPFDS